MLKAVYNQAVIISEAGFKVNWERPWKLSKLRDYCHHIKYVNFNQTPLNLMPWRAFLFLKNGLIEEMKSEPPQYLAAAADVANTVDPLVWWKSHEEELPNWASAARKVLSSSAEAERVFSILSNSFKNLVCKTI